MTLRDLEIRNVADRAVLVEANDVRLEYLVLQTGLTEGIAAVGVRRTRVSGVSIQGSPVAAGMRFDRTISTLVEASVMAGGKHGVKVRGGAGFVLRNSTIAGAGNGVVLQSLDGEPLTGAHIFGNEIRRTERPPTAPDSNLDLVVGAGVWADSVISPHIQSNTLVDMRTYGVAFTGLNGPTLDAISIGNHASQMGISAEAWDGIGTACTDSPSTQPPTWAETNKCGSPSLGVPYPKVTADLLLHAANGTVISAGIPQP